MRARLTCADVTASLALFLAASLFIQAGRYQLNLNADQLIAMP
jgi:hypothetical protein